MRYTTEVGQHYSFPKSSFLFINSLFPSPFLCSSAPPANGFSQMARMMDSLILDSLSTTPYAYTKITTHRPVKKATSTNHLPSNGLGTTSTTSTATRNTFHSSNKKIPTQGKGRRFIMKFPWVAKMSFTYFHFVLAFLPRDHNFSLKS